MMPLISDEEYKNRINRINDTILGYVNEEDGRLNIPKDILNILMSQKDILKEQGFSADLLSALDREKNSNVDRLVEEYKSQKGHRSTEKLEVKKTDEIEKLEINPKKRAPKLVDAGPGKPWRPEPPESNVDPDCSYDEESSAESSRPRNIDDMRRQRGCYIPK